MNLIEIDDVWVVFDTPNGHVESLRGATLNLRRGEWMAIVGHNGSGKSTLGRVIAGLCDISRGKVRRHATSVRIVFQNPDTQAVGDTVLEDVLFQPGMEASGELGTESGTEPDATAKRFEDALLPQASHALSLVNLWEAHTQPVETLSGGQKQRLAIASAVVAKADILVLDEVTTMLDDQHRRQVWDAVRKLNKEGVCVVWITQHMDELWLADVVAVVDKGAVSFVGEPRDFFYSQPSESKPKLKSPCERMGFVPPIAVAVARELGTALAPTNRPLTVDELLEAIDGWPSL